MWLRNIVLAAVVAAPLMWSSAPVSAQQRGQDRAAAVQAAQPTPNGNGAVNGNGAENRQTEPPKGVMRRFTDGLINVLPRGIRRRFGTPEPAPVPEPEPEPVPEPEPEPEPETPPCVTTVVFVNGAPMLRDCNGNLTPMVPSFPG